jgi:DNA-binding CsgD family transcriptional regulator
MDEVAEVGPSSPDEKESLRLPGHVDDWRNLLALAVCGGDWSPAGIARFAGISFASARSVEQAAREAGLIGTDGHIDEMASLGLVAGLSSEAQALVHLVAARHYAARGPDHHRDLLRHARAASATTEPVELIALLDHAGEMSMAYGAYEDARDLLAFADELDAGGDQRAVAKRLCLLAAAVDGTGHVETARRHLARAISLASLTGDDTLLAKAAVQYALPVDWYAGDERAAGFLHRASQGDLEPAERVLIDAARALVEMRVPLVEDDGQQAAWITRPGVAQPLAVRALEASVGLSEDVRLLALLAWRGTHRSPEHLEGRLALSTEAFNLAQHLRHPSFQVDSGVWLAVDAYESGDRATYDSTVALVRWVAERDGNPRLRWRALTLVAGQAMLDCNLELFTSVQKEATALAVSANLPGTRASDLFFFGQVAIMGDDRAGLETVCAFGEMPLANNPLAMSGLAYAHTKVGDLAVAERLAQQALDRSEPEGSMLLVGTRVAAVALLLDSPDLRARVCDVLSPWSGHSSVDANGWWCDGPVDAWLALLHAAAGDQSTALAYLGSAWKSAETMRDARTLERLAPLRDLVDAIVDPVVLTPRQRAVLELVASGATNAQMAEALNFSVATVRLTLASLFDIFGTRQRNELAVMARAAGVEIAHPRTRAT